MGGTSFVFVNVHLFFGADNLNSIRRRSLETFAVAKWSDLRQRSPFSFTRELVALGDFNMPKSEPGDQIFDALTRLGLQVPEHSSQIASSISSDANYDQAAFLPHTTQDCFVAKGVFDYDQVIFPAPLAERGERQELQGLPAVLHLRPPAHVGAVVSTAVRPASEAAGPCAPWRGDGRCSREARSTEGRQCPLR